MVERSGSVCGGGVLCGKRRMGQVVARENVVGFDCEL